MKKVVLFSMLLVLALSFSVFASGGLIGKKIYIDPGHGGTDGGAIGPTGLREADVNLRVGTVLKDCLMQYGGATVRMSRTGDTTLSLSYRTTEANNWGADRFISIHHNYSSDPATNGTTTYCYLYGGSSAFDLRDKVHAQLLVWGGLPDLGAQTATYYVLKYAQMGAVLTEASFISNPTEESRLRDTSYIWRQGYYIYKGFCNHYGVPY